MVGGEKSLGVGRENSSGVGRENIFIVVGGEQVKVWGRKTVLRWWEEKKFGDGEGKQF